MSNSLAISTKTPTRFLLSGLALVALSTAALPYITGYGMQLMQIVVLGAWALLAAVTSSTFADQNHSFLWPIAAVLNVALFSILALPVYLIFRRRAQLFASLFLMAWLVFYLACLFVLFPATDGP